MSTLLRCLVPCLFFSLAHAQQAPAPVKKAVEHWLKIQTKGLPGQVSLEVGELDPGNQLTPCNAFDISRQPGAQPWGKTHVLVRCMEDAGWRIYIPVHIRVKMEYLISARPIAQGQPLSADDLGTLYGDISEMPANTLTDPALAIDRVATSSIQAGRPLRADMLKAQVAVRQGQTVRVVSRGAGFEVTNEGRALNNATEGQVAQVRLGSGQVVRGVARSDGVVDVSF